MTFLRKWTHFALVLLMINVAVDGAPNLTISKGECGGTTTLYCTSPDIVIGQPYQWNIQNPVKASIYDHTEDGNLISNKYRGTISNGTLVLEIFNTSSTDANLYSCNYGFRDSNNVTFDGACLPELTVSSAECGGVATLTCVRSNIAAGDSYEFYIYEPNKTKLYDHTHNGNLVLGKYNGTIQNGSIVLNIYNLSESDAETFSCSHGFLESDQVELQVTCSQPASGANNNSGPKVRTNLVVMLFATILTFILVLAS